MLKEKEIDALARRFMNMSAKEVARRSRIRFDDEVSEAYLVLTLIAQHSSLRITQKDMKNFLKATTMRKITTVSDIIDKLNVSMAVNYPELEDNSAIQKIVSASDFTDEPVETSVFQPATESKNKGSLPDDLKGRAFVADREKKETSKEKEEATATQDQQLAKKKEEPVKMTITNTPFNIHNLRLKISGYTSDSISEVGPDVVFSDSLSFKANAFLAEKSNHIPIKNQITITDAEDKKRTLVLPEGLITIIGPSGTGKTMIAKYIAQELGCEYVRFHEPETPALVSPNLMIAKLEDFIYGTSKAIVIDSFRFFAYNADSRAAAMSGGISASLFSDLTTLSIIAASLGKTIIVVLNFLSQSSNNKDTILNAVQGATSGYLSTDSIAEVGHFDYALRTDENKRTLSRGSIFFDDVLYKDETTTEVLQEAVQLESSNGFARALRRIKEKGLDYGN